MKTCSSCGLVNEDRANFCAKCGGKLAGTDQTAGAAGLSAAPAAPAQEAGQPDARLVSLRANSKVVEENACAVCGGRFELGAEVVRCPRCGKYSHADCGQKAGGCASPECRGEDLKACPYCAEKIKKTAVKCRYCGQILDQELKVTLEAGQPKGDVKEAKDALIYSLIGLFCFGFILGPIAIAKGSKALNIIRDDPGYTGKGKATAGIVIGIIDIVGWLLGLIIRFSN